MQKSTYSTSDNSKPKFYAACADGRHPGDFAPEEYARNTNTMMS